MENLRRETRKEGKEQNQHPGPKPSIQRKLAERANKPTGKKAVTRANSKEQVGGEEKIEVQAAPTSQAPEYGAGLLTGSMSRERMGEVRTLIHTWHQPPPGSL